MSARILVVDDTPLNVKLLQAKLTHEYYSVSTAENGRVALEKAVQEKPDLILLDVMMPEIDGFETCRRLKADAQTRNIPVIMVTALADVPHRVQGLEAGADDFLTKPIHDIALFARIRSCLRLKTIMDEWRMREGSGGGGVFQGTGEGEEGAKPPATIALLDDHPPEQLLLQEHIEKVGMQVRSIKEAGQLPGLLAQHPIDVCLINLHLQQGEGVRVCANLKALEATRTLPIVVYGEESDMETIAKALDVGANDYIVKPIDRLELQARLHTQIRHKRAYDRLRLSYEKNMQLAITDPLTGAYNRHYLDQTLPRFFDRSQKNSKPVSIVMIDIDHFKKINDTHGHHAGDQVLQEMVKRVQESVRLFDMVIRLGGEEFAVIMPEAPYPAALQAAERLRQAIANAGFALENGQSLNVTISSGVASAEKGDIPASVLFQRADKALYRAKALGRNQVVGEDALGEG